MKKAGIIYLLLSLVIGSVSASEWVRVNQKGYLQEDIKVAVWLTDQKKTVSDFQIIDNLTKKVVYQSRSIRQQGEQGAFANTARLSFSDFKRKGSYYIKVGETTSPVFLIGNDVYASSVEVPLKYMRQQRCGYNPFLKDSCHRNDGRIIYHPTRTGEK